MLPNCVKNTILFFSTDYAPVLVCKVTVWTVLGIMIDMIVAYFTPKRISLLTFPPYFCLKKVLMIWHP